MTDLEGNVYNTVKIGTQWWMSENLKTTVNADGNNLVGVYCYNNDEGNINQYGRLYTWEAANNACPNGWRLPTRQEFLTLINYLGNNSGTKLKVGGSSGFEVKLGGNRTYTGEYEMLNTTALYWTSTPLFPGSDHNETLYLHVNNNDAEVSGYGVIGAGSVRYIKD